MQADAYASFGRLYDADRQGGLIIEAACWAHSRRKSFDLARLSKAPIAAEAVKRIDALFAVERGIDGLVPQQWLRVRQEHSRPLVGELQMWLREQRTNVSKHNDTGKAIDYLLKRWNAFTRFLDDGRLCLPNNAAERELRADVDPLAWLAAMLTRLPDHPAKRLNELLPWNWRPTTALPKQLEQRPTELRVTTIPWSSRDAHGATNGCDRRKSKWLRCVPIRRARERERRRVFVCVRTDAVASKWILNSTTPADRKARKRPPIASTLRTIKLMRRMIKDRYLTLDATFGTRHAVILRETVHRPLCVQTRSPAVFVMRKVIGYAVLQR
jgi:Transposase IS66 family/IS66 C-terminal element